MNELINPIFQSNSNFEQVFIDGLEKMLESDELGVFILVLANAVYDEKIWQVLKPKLQDKFNQLNAQPLTGATDDIDVFKQLQQIDINNLSVTQFKQLGKFELQYNPLRALRPQRMSGKKTKGMSAEFNENEFNFNKPFLQKEMLWKGDLFSKNISLFYNKFPFAKLHGIIVVEPEKQHAQLLSYELHQFAWMMSNAIGLSIQGFTLAYNSYGAFASVNHFHLQCFVRSEPLPIEADEKYPLTNHWFSSITDAWSFIEALHADEQPYNLIYRQEKILIVVRNRQDDYQHSNWTSGYAWYEACGGLSTFNLDDFNNLNEQELSDELSKLIVS